MTTCIGVYLAVAGDAFDVVFLCPDVLDEILDLIESVTEGFPVPSLILKLISYFHNIMFMYLFLFFL